ncbi:5383_t:CDS:2, partial [Cetraspora pellucida]
MPCHVDTIVKVNQVHQTYKEDSKLIVVWVIGVYPVRCEDCELEMVLFISTVGEERDPNTQAVFEKNKYYCIGGKMTVASSTHLTIKRDSGSNRCPLKVSLVGIIQEVSMKINNENAIVNVLVNDYAEQSYNFTVKTVFPYCNPRFKHLMNSIRSNESVLFVVGQMETEPASYKSVCLRLLSAYQSVNEDLSKISKVENLYSAEEKVKNENDCIEYPDSYTEFVNICDEEGIINNDKYEETAIYNNEKHMCSHKRSTKGKEKMISPVVHNTR